MIKYPLSIRVENTWYCIYVYQTDATIEYLKLFLDRVFKRTEYLLFVPVKSTSDKNKNILYLGLSDLILDSCMKLEKKNSNEFER